MKFSRRRFLQTSALAPIIGSLPQIAYSEISLGTSKLTTVSDGSLLLPGAFIFEPMPKDELEPILTEFGLSDDRLTPECNLALYRDGTNTVLFDVGSGPDFMPTAGVITDSLSAMGLSPDDITHVVFTHAHPDHIWGLLDDFDEPLFLNATYMMGRTEWDYWWNPETVNTIGEARAAFAVGAKRRMEAIEDAVVLFNDGFKKPTWASGSDQDAATAAGTRKMLLDRLTSENMSLIGFHLPNGGIGLAEADGDSYRYVGL